MRHFPIHRRGVTILELLIVVAIVAILLALVLAAVQNAREASARLASANKQRQIILAVHQFSATKKGQLPVIGHEPNPASRPGVIFPNIQNRSLFDRILPYIEQDAAFEQQSHISVDLFLSPSDPTVHLAAVRGTTTGLCSYAANGQVFRSNPRLPDTFSDGTSHTIAFGEHYAKCGLQTYLYWEARFTGGGARAAFADDDVHVVPITMAGVTVASQPGLTFQAAPSIDSCISRICQTPHRNGMITAMADGSVRTLSPSILESTFWSLVTPNGADAAPLD